ncbi:MAG: hypothetical protein J6L23_05610, partial [Clostridia bacterium]|nr:hypothetical protein [Clostridia bacterium]
KRKNKSKHARIKPYVLALFSVSEVFAVAKVKLCRCRTSGTVKLLAKAHSEVKFALTSPSGETSLT